MKVNEARRVFSLLGVFIKSRSKQKLWLASAVIHDVCIFPFVYGLRNCSSNLLKHKTHSDTQISPVRQTSFFTRADSLSEETHLDSSSDVFSEETTVLQVVLDDDIGDGVEHKLHVLGVSCASEVGVDFLGVLLLVQILKFGLDVSLGLLVLVRACGTESIWGLLEREAAEGVARFPRRSFQIYHIY